MFVSAALLALVVAQAASVGIGGKQFPPRDAGRVAVQARGGDSEISGLVRSRAGAPLRRAVVGLRSHDIDSLAASTITDGDGEYHFERLPAGRYVVRASRIGFGRRFHGEDRAGQPPAVVEIGPGRHVRGVDVVLPKAAVVTGRIVDEGGQPVSSANVVVLREVARRIGSGVVIAGGDLTDDRGVYRIFDLDPGEYYVRATALSASWLNSLEGSEFATTDDAGLARDAPDGYAPTYYPGAVRLTAARRITVAESQEVDRVDFAVARVPFTSVSGVVVAPSAANPAGSEVTLTPADGVGVVAGGAHSARAEPDGRFALRNVPQGQYVLTATGSTATGDAAFGQQVVTLRGDRMDELSVVLRPGVEVSGTLRFEGADPQWHDIVNLRVTTRMVDATQVRRDHQLMIDGDHRFRFRGLPPGQRVFGVAGMGENRVLESISLQGRDITDQPIELSGQSRITGLEVILTDQVSSLRGAVRAAADGAAVVVLAFSTDPDLWFPDSRHVVTGRPAQNGRFSFRGIPPGDYWVAAAPLSVAGSDDWLSPRFLERLRTRAMRVSVRKGDTVDVDLQARAR